MLQETLAIIKPDGVMKHVTVDIKQRYIDAGLTIMGEYRKSLSLLQAMDLYKEHKDKFFFEGLVLSMISGPCVVLLLKGVNAVQVVRELNGATDPSKAAPGSIRHDFRSAGGPYNTVHGSDSANAAHREATVLLRE